MIDRGRIASLVHKSNARSSNSARATIVRGIHHVAYRKLRDYCGRPKIKIEIEDPVQQLALVDEHVKQRLEVDVWGINPRGGRKRSVRSWSEHGYDKLLDEWGIEWWKPQDGGLYL